MPRLYWLDYETTGTNARLHRLLEMALAVTDLSNPFAFTPVYHAVFRYPKDERAFLFDNPIVLEMHTKNGLLDECAQSEITPAQAEAHLLELVPEVSDKNDLPILAGSTVSFDKQFMDEHMPRLAARFSHRFFDVSAIKLFCQSRGMAKIPKGEAHRCVADIEESVEHGRQCDLWLEGYYASRSALR